MAEYTVTRIPNIVAEYCTVEADSAENAIELAKTCGEECWEANPNDVMLADYSEYAAELEE